MRRVEKLKSASQRTNRKSKTLAARIELQQRINELLWDFYGEFPLSISDWTSVTVGKRGDRARAAPGAASHA